VYSGGYAAGVAGLGTSAMFVTVQLRHSLVAPGVGYYHMTAAGIVASLGGIAATMPLLRRITGPEVARNGSGAGG
jgi:hypothetical protein